MECSRPGSTGPSGKCPCPWWVVGTRWFFSPFQHKPLYNSVRIEKNPVWGLNTTSGRATPSQWLAEKMISSKTCWNNNRVPGCSDHEIQNREKIKKKLPNSKKHVKYHEILLLPGLTPIPVIDLSHGCHFKKSRPPGQKYGPKEKRDREIKQ